MSELLRIAILGTSQAAGSPRSDTEADPIVDALGLEARGERERALLLRAGTEAVLRRAGTRARREPPSALPAPPEVLARASPALSGLLAGLLSGDSTELLSEALEAMLVAGLRLPEELLPLALDEQDPRIRALLVPVLGERGRWLLEQSRAWAREKDAEDAWGWARAAISEAPASLPENAEQLWEEGTLREREELLRRGRELDPERALRWVVSTFRADKAEQRKRWLELLATSLSSADAAFLEAATQDRSAMVRVEAARLSWALPDSAPARAVRERLDALIAGTSSSLAVKLPSEPFDPALDRLGILEIPPRGVGRRQWWLAELVSAVPPEYFTARFAAPSELVAIAARHELGKALLDGWTSAALRFVDRAWYAPLWDAWFQEEDPSGWTEPEPLFALTQRLAADSAWEELEPRLIRCIAESRHPALLNALPRPWPDTVAQSLLSALPARPGWFSEVWRGAATGVPLSAVPSPLAPPAYPPGRKLPFDDALHKFASVIELRQRIAREVLAHGHAEAKTTRVPKEPS